MNRTAIEWCTHSWNPMTGCLHGCPYCYARKMAKRLKGTKAWPKGFEPVFHAKRLEEPLALKKPAIIFAGSMTDIFGDWWSEAQIWEVLEHIWQAKQHYFVVLTKNPSRMYEMLRNHYYGEEDLFRRVLFGTSVTGSAPEADLHVERNRLHNLIDIHSMGFNTVISFEPLLHDPVKLINSVGGIAWADWIIIGGQTGPTKIPDPAWVYALRYQTIPGQPTFCKDNLGRPHDQVYSRDFPDGLIQVAKAWGK